MTKGKYIRTPEHRARLSAARRGRPGWIRHGMHGTPTYNSWAAMLQRCGYTQGISYANYGGRGITACDRWRSFENFLADMGVKPEGRTLDRIDNDGNYTPENCRWATYHEQRMNQRPKRRAA